MRKVETYILLRDEFIKKKKGIKEKVFGTSNAICKEAYAEFKKKITELFASSIPKNLLELTMESRERLFLSTLRGVVKETLSL